MNNSGWAPGGGTKSNTQYIGSVEQALTNEWLHNFKIRNLEERAAQDANNAYNNGYNEGLDAGYAQGWNEAAAEGNKNMQQQLIWTGEHRAEKERLQVEFQKQTELIKQLNARIDAFEKENEKLKNKISELGAENKEQSKIIAESNKTNASLREMVSTLESANARLEQEFDQLEKAYEHKTVQYNQVVSQYNKAMVYVSAVTDVLDEVTKDNTLEAQHIRDVFAKWYGIHVKTAMDRGLIPKALEEDAQFTGFLPKTQNFIIALMEKRKAFYAKEKGNELDNTLNDTN